MALGIEDKFIGGETEIAFHTFVVLGGFIFIILFIIMAIRILKDHILSGEIGTGITTRVILPSVITSFLSACLFSFIGWLLTGYLITVKLMSILGAIIGFIIGITNFKKNTVDWKKDLSRLLSR